MINLKITKNKKIILTVVLAIILLLIVILMLLNRKNIFSNIINTKEKMEANMKITYRKTKINDDATECTLLLTAYADKGIEKIIRPDGEEITPIDRRQKLVLDYTVNFDEDYVFELIDTTGNPHTETIHIPPVGDIYTIEDLEDVDLYLIGDYQLMNNLDFRDRNSYSTDERYEYYNKDEDNDGNPDNSWTPIGNEGHFSGIFSGNYHTINNLYINSPNMSYAGLFGKISTATIQNFELKNIEINAGSCIGGVAGLDEGSFGTVIQKVYVEGNIKGISCVAGILGSDYNPYSQSPDIKECHVKSNVIGEGDYGGGILGDGIAGIYDCYTEGKMKSKSWAGGLSKDRSGRHYRCYSIMDCSECYYPLGGWSNTACFWADETSKKTGSGVTVDQMKTQSTYTDAGWNFDTVWKMNPETGYPMLQWEENITPIEEKTIDAEITDLKANNKKINATINARLTPEENGVKYKYYVSKKNDLSIVYVSSDMENGIDNEIIGLDPNTDYKVKIRAYFDNGNNYTDIIKEFHTEFSECQIIEGNYCHHNYTKEQLDTINVTLFDGIKDDNNGICLEDCRFHSWYQGYVIFTIPAGGKYITFSTGPNQKNHGEVSGNGIAIFLKYNPISKEYEEYTEFRTQEGVEDYSKTWFDGGQYKLTCDTNREGRKNIAFNEWTLSDE